MLKINKHKMTANEANRYREYVIKYTYDDEKDPFEQWNEKAKALQALRPDLTLEQAKDDQQSGKSAYEITIWRTYEKTVPIWKN